VRKVVKPLCQTFTVITFPLSESASGGCYGLLFTRRAAGFVMFHFSCMLLFSFKNLRERKIGSRFYTMHHELFQCGDFNIETVN
jgi:hypothetical protein